MTDNGNQGDSRRTKRRYAHELYPAGEEGVVRDLAIEVPHLYAVAIGSEVWDTGWFAAIGSDERRQEAADRTVQLVYTRQVAFLADAIAQGLTGDAAWQWAEDHLADETGELAYERAVHHGVDPDRIKPYPCGPEPINHRHYSHGSHCIATRIPLRESECADCTEPVEVSEEQAR